MASFQHPKSRHARRGYPMLTPAEPTKKSDVRSRIPLSLVPHSLVPCSRLPRTPAADGFFKAWLTSMLREGRRRTEIAADRQHGAYWGHQRFH